MNRQAATLVLGLSCLVVASCREKVSPRPAVISDEPSAPIPTARDQLAAVAKAPARADTSCPDGMALVEGEYCPNVQLNCKRYLDPKGRYEHFRCADYGPSTCKSKARRHLRYCIDRTEYVPPGETLPANHKSFTHAEQTCKSLGKRVCMESEWNFACEGEEMRPYPYGFSRDTEACNADRLDIVTDTGTLRDLRAPPASHPRCASPFGVYDLSGNVEEFVAIDGSAPVRPAMKGAYWQPSRNFCRAAQTAHDRYYNGTETGFRCCSDTR
jgi:sulfatase modifying factor 1